MTVLLEYMDYRFVPKCMAILLDASSMLALCLLLSVIYYIQSYANMIDRSQYT